jgi:adenosylhomocysteinase
MSHQVMFQGTSADARQALAHYLRKLQDRAAGVVSLIAAPNGAATFAAQARLEVPAVGTVMLSVSAPANPAYADAHSYAAALTVTDVAPGADPGAARALFNELDALPLTSLELAEVRRQFPLTRQLAASCGPTALAGHAFFMAIHHMTDFVAMMDALEVMGADPRYITILDKGYPYTQRHRVDGWLRDTLGIHVDLYPDRVASVGAHIARARAAGLKTMIFDDGGHAWPVVAGHYPGEMGEFTGVVEQTMSGIWKLEGVPLPVPVVSGLFICTQDHDQR